MEALEAVHGISFTMQNSAELCEFEPLSNFEEKSIHDVSPLADPASGDANDWYTHDVGIRFSYTIELRDQGFGFELPPEQGWARFDVFEMDIRPKDPFASRPLVANLICQFCQISQ